MAKQTINTGTSDLAGDGESIRTAFDKINDNFDDLYASRVVSSLTDISVTTQPATGGGALSYDSATGVITYTPPELSNLSTYDQVQQIQTTVWHLQGSIASHQSQTALSLQYKVGIDNLKSIIAASADFADFQLRIASASSLA